MQTYQLKFAIGGRFQALPDSQTIFGAMCWAIRDVYGEAKLTEMLADFQNHPQRFVVSSMFQFDILPMPKLKKMRVEATTLADFQHKKMMRQIHSVSVAAARKIFDNTFDMSVYQNLLENKPQSVFKVEEQTLYLVEEQVVSVPKTMNGLRNMIDRLSGTTGEEGQLFYSEHQQLPAATKTHVIIQTADLKFVESLFRYLSDGGYGRDKSVGINQFSYESAQPFVFENSIGLPYLISKYIPQSGEINWNDGQLGYTVASPNYVVESRQQFNGRYLKAEVVAFQEGSIIPTVEPKSMYGQLAVVQEIAEQRIYQNGLGLFL
ncbi:MAG: type III-A CRISPR-associated RAMP protein Csm4 [Culicoidibacterales bacterium]